MYFHPISSLYEKSYPRNINYMPVVKFFVCLGVFAYLTSNENPINSTDSFIFFNLQRNKTLNLGLGHFQRTSRIEASELASTYICMLFLVGRVETTRAYSLK